MNLSPAGDVAGKLKAGDFPPVPSWLLAEAAQCLIDELAAAAALPMLTEVRNVVKVLNEHCYFELTRKIAQAWLDRFAFDATIQRRLVQALINTTLLDEAERLAQKGVDKCKGSLADANASAELTEFQGLLGRIAKQRFVTTGDLSSLVRATDQYLAEYEQDKARNYWHGINALACLTLEREAALPRALTQLPTDLANGILATVTESYGRKPNSWLAATASEVSLALGKCEQAELWLYRFLAREDTWPFNIDSYYRQLREIWGGDPLSSTSCADRLAGIIARFIAKAQSRITLTPSQVPELKAAVEGGKPGFEKNFLGESNFSVASIRALLKAFESIGCVTNDIGERLGTGFLVPGLWLKSQFGDSPVFVTNAHVISNEVTNAIAIDKAFVTFELETAVNGQRARYPIESLLFTSIPGSIGITGDKELDCTIVRLKGLPAAAVPLTATATLPLISPRTKAFVAGHPRGAGLQIALHDSALLDIDDDERLVHYRTPTDPGSSGSPVFNADWQVIALHHAGMSTTPRLHGNGTYEANEGISMAAIRRRLDA